MKKKHCNDNDRHWDSEKQIWVYDSDWEYKLNRIIEILDVKYSPRYYSLYPSQEKDKNREIAQEILVAIKD